MRTRNIIALSIALFTISAMAAVAQGKGALTIQCNVSGAQVYLDGKLVGNTAPNFSIILPARSYSLKVSKSGYQDFATTVNLPTSGTTIQVSLLARGQIQAPQQVQQPQQVPQSQQIPQPQPVPQPVQSFLSVNANAPGADVYLNGNRAGQTPFSAQLVPGTYNLVVRAPGYNDYNQTVVVNGPTQINAMLTAIQATLSVNANVPGADIYLNGNRAGQTPFSAQLVPGTYSLVVRVSGYNDFSQTVVVNGQTQINAMLTAIQATLSVNANVPGADVYLNGNRAGQTPFTVQLVPGTYSLVVRAAGYGDYNQAVVVSGTAQVNAILTPLAATWQLSLPAGDMNTNGRGNGVLVFIDGSQQQGVSGQIPPGRHSIRLIAGSLVAETAIDVQAGRVYTIEPYFMVNVK